MLGLINILSADYIIASEEESGNGRADIILVPKAGQGDRAMIIEYKVAKNQEDLVLVAQMGLKQIKDKQYDAKIKRYGYVKQILKLSMAFYGKHTEIVYQFTEL